MFVPTLTASITHNSQNAVATAVCIPWTPERPSGLPPMISARSFTLCGLMFKSSVRFEFIFMG